MAEGEFATRFLDRYLREDRATPWMAAEFAILERALTELRSAGGAVGDGGERDLS